MSGLAALRSRYTVAADPLRTQRRIELALVVLGLVLCLQLLYSGARLLLGGAPEPVAPAGDALQVKPITRPEAVAQGRSDEIRARPLFWGERRPLEGGPAAPEPEEEQQASGKLKDVKLLGIFGGGDTAGIIALVKDKKQRILQGERLLGWRLEKVESNRIVLVDGPRREELQLLKRKVVAVEKPPAPEVKAPAAGQSKTRKSAAPRSGTGSVGNSEQGAAPAAGRRLSFGGRPPVPAADTGKRPQ